MEDIGFLLGGFEDELILAERDRDELCDLRGHRFQVILEIVDECLVHHDFVLLILLFIEDFHVLELADRVVQSAEVRHLHALQRLVIDVQTHRELAEARAQNRIDKQIALTPNVLQQVVVREMLNQLLSPQEVPSEREFRVEFQLLTHIVLENRLLLSHIYRSPPDKELYVSLKLKANASPPPPRQIQRIFRKKGYYSALHPA